MSYKGFSDYGLNIVAAFDTSDDVAGTEEEGKRYSIWINWKTSVKG
jgi:NADH/NAD ratio-sensing transcriptional regulator Rex